ncbi:hypothetical protein [Actinomadura bangladeshensis]|uniref:Uncharacterized protein n=1 Tax=Actinomadura bangladeshensis TaxID=453573 RepID=A0A6L9QAK7_9ACTN|nr:hypothetical protein [Actinomadura bangladeshensis]NEA21577.1 hypothetical protein [Actinomadura bangladeshensis]NEA22537.1 hypothetical protein [Actinomadura bangladeshensis]
MTKPLKARPTVYKGIRMRSRLEAGFAAWLDETHFDWEYEPCAFATEDGQYLPDFRLRNVFVAWMEKPATVYIEVKPTSFEMVWTRAFGTWQTSSDDAPARNAAKLACAARIIGQSEPTSLLFLAKQNEPLTWIADVADAIDIGQEYGASPLSLIWRPGDRRGFAYVPFGGGPWAKDYWRTTHAAPALSSRTSRARALLSRPSRHDEAIAAMKQELEALWPIDSEENRERYFDLFEKLVNVGKERRRELLAGSEFEGEA